MFWYKMRRMAHDHTQDKKLIFLISGKKNLRQNIAPYGALQVNYGKSIIKCSHLYILMTRQIIRKTVKAHMKMTALFSVGRSLAME